jgi:hypothetical protein
MTSRDIVIISLAIVFSPIIIPVLFIGALIVWFTTEQPSYNCDKGRHIYENSPNGVTRLCMLCDESELI